MLLVRVLVAEKDKAATGEAHPTNAADLAERWQVEVENFCPKEGLRDPRVLFTMCLVSLEAP